MAGAFSQIFFVFTFKSSPNVLETLFTDGVADEARWCKWYVHRL